MGVRIEWNGDAVIAKIRAITDGVSKAGAEKIAEDARNRVKVSPRTEDQYGNRAGSLRASIRVEKSKFKNGGYLVTAGTKGIWGDPYYARFVELGSPGTSYKKSKTPKGRRMVGTPRTPVKRHPFMRPAAARNKRKIYRMYREAIEK